MDSHENTPCIFEAVKGGVILFKYPEHRYQEQITEDRVLYPFPVNLFVALHSPEVHNDLLGCLTEGREY
jgi:hypothetical protein